VPIRGNVATRIAKLAAGEADVTLLAAAGLERLGETGVGHPLDADEWLPAPAQGAIGIECRTDDTATRDLLATIDHAESRAAVIAERALLAALGGSCHSPIAALTRSQGEHLALTAAIFSADGAERVEGSVTFAAGDLEAPARLAADLLARATPGIAALFAGS
jgi:hydroxymethylbilane synthase